MTTGHSDPQRSRAGTAVGDRWDEIGGSMRPSPYLTRCSDPPAHPMHKDHACRITGHPIERPGRCPLCRGRDSLSPLGRRGPTWNPSLPGQRRNRHALARLQRRDFDRHRGRPSIAPPALTPRLATRRKRKNASQDVITRPTRHSRIEQSVRTRIGLGPQISSARRAGPTRGISRVARPIA